MEKKVVPPFVRNPYNYDVVAASDESALACLDPSLAVQAAREEVDINTIVKRFGLTGQLPDNVRMPEYGDFTGIRDYRTALHAVMEAEAAFLELPAEVRSKFDNDPQVMLEFVSDPKNLPVLREMGLAKPAEAVAEAVAPVVASPPK